MSDEEIISALAKAIADGDPVDWCAAESSATTEQKRAVVRRFKRISEIAAIYRTGATGAVCANAPDSALEDTSSLPSWGHLRLLEKVGEGAFGEVFRAWDGNLAREVALKLLRSASPPSSVDDRTKAIEEGRFAASVRHPNVVTVYGADRIDNRTGFWTEFIHGRTLADLVREHGRFSATESAAIGIDVCRALAAVHAAGLLHRDVKAHNVMRERGGRIVLLDFGAGRQLLKRAVSEADRLTGTPLYAAPEVWQNGQVTARSDIYSLGVLLYHLVTGSYPVRGANIHEMQEAHRAGRRVFLRDERPDIPDAFAEVVQRAIDPDPSQRFESAGAFEAALKTASGGLDVAAASSLTPIRQRLKWIAAALVMAGLFLMGSTAFLGWKLHPATHTAFRDRDWVLVTAFENRTGDSTFDRTLEYALEHELSNSTYVNVTPRERIEDTLRLMARRPDTVIDARLGPEVAVRDGGIRVVVTGAIERLGNGYTMTARIVDPLTSATIASDREEATTTSLVPNAVRRVSNWIRVTLGEAALTIKHNNEQLEKATTSSLLALRLYSEGLHAFNAWHLSQAEALFGAALAEDPSFASAHVWMAWTFENTLRHSQAIASARQALDLIDTTTERERYWILGSFYAIAHDDTSALGHFEALAQRYPDDVGGIENLLRLYRQAGRLGELIELTLRVAHLRPNDLYAQARAAATVLELRSLEAARPHIRTAQALLNKMPAPPTTASSDTITFFPFDSKAATQLWFESAVYVRLLPAHELWMLRRSAEASRVLDDVASRSDTNAGGDWAIVMLGKLRLALGQVRDAERVYARIKDPNLRTITMSEVALARNNAPAIVSNLRSYRSDDYAAVSLLVRAGNLTLAKHLLHRIPSFPPHSTWAADEIEEARGNTLRIDEALKSDLPWTRVMTGIRTFLYSESLARAAMASGRTAEAVRVLEQMRPLGEKLFVMSTHSGYGWERTQKLLADLYRQTGQLDKARAIERDLLAALGAADEDCLLVADLKKKGL